MSIDHTHCYTVTCDTCRTVFDETNDYMVHFDTADEATNYVAEHGWTFTENGQPLCTRCTANIRCNQNGHDYSPWYPCHCGGLIPEHALSGCDLYRYCNSCEHTEAATLADLPTVEEPHTFGR